MKILITGGTGLIGLELLKSLGQNKNFQLYLLTRQKDITFNFQVNVQIINDDFFSINDFRSITKTMDIVIHLAWSSFPRSSNISVVEDYMTNVTQTLKLLDACVASNIKKFIFASSGGAVYGVQPSIPIAETAIPNPISIYGIHKLCIEHYLYYYYKHFKLPFTSLRIATAYGSNTDFSKKQGVIAHWLNNIAQNKPITLYGDGSIVRDYVHTQDIANAITQAINAEATNYNLNIGTGIGVSLLQLIELIQKITKTSSLILKEKNSNFDVPYNVLSIERANTCLSWQPKMNIQNGIKILWKNLYANAK